MGGSALTKLNLVYGLRKQDWAISDVHPSMTIISNRLTGQQLQSYEFVVNDSSEFRAAQQIFQARYKSQTLVASKYLHVDQKNDLCSSLIRGTVFLERIPIRLTDVNEIPYPDTLHFYSQCFKGFSQLYSQFGYFDINEQLIGCNINGKVKVWMNSNFDSVYPQVNYLKREGSELQMLEKLMELLDLNSNLTLHPEDISRFVSQTRPRTFLDAHLVLDQYVKNNGVGIPSYSGCVSQMYVALKNQSISEGLFPDSTPRKVYHERQNSTPRQVSSIERAHPETGMGLVRMGTPIADFKSQSPKQQRILFGSPTLINYHQAPKVQSRSQQVVHSSSLNTQPNRAYSVLLSPGTRLNNFSNTGISTTTPVPYPSPPVTIKMSPSATNPSLASNQVKRFRSQSPVVRKNQPTIIESKSPNKNSTFQLSLQKTITFPNNEYYSTTVSPNQRTDRLLVNPNPKTLLPRHPSIQRAPSGSRNSANRIVFVSNYNQSSGGHQGGKKLLSTINEQNVGLTISKQSSIGESTLLGRNPRMSVSGQKPQGNVYVINNKPSQSKIYSLYDNHLPIDSLAGSGQIFKIPHAKQHQQLNSSYQCEFNAVRHSMPSHISEDQVRQSKAEQYMKSSNGSQSSSRTVHLYHNGHQSIELPYKEVIMEEDQYQSMDQEVKRDLANLKVRINGQMVSPEGI